MWMLELLTLLLMVFSFGAILWFVWQVWLKKVLRARRIAQARLDRRMREAREEGRQASD